MSNAALNPSDAAGNAAGTPAPQAGLPAAAAPRRIYRPAADIFETGEGLTLLLDMPGVGPDDVDVTLEKRVLTIRASVQPARPERLQPVYAEYEEGDYERSFALADDFDPDRIDASLSNGVLTLKLPRAAEATPKKINVKGS